MSKIIAAKAVTNSADHPQGRVRLELEGVWEGEQVMPTAVLAGAAINKGDIVYVDVSDGFDNPLILARMNDSTVTHKQPVDSGATILWESVTSSGNWTIATVKGGKLEIHNQQGLVLRANGGTIELGNLERILSDIVRWLNTHTHPASGGATSAPITPYTGSTSIKAGV